MMKKILIFMCCVFGYFMPAWGCSYWASHGDYEIRDGKVYYQHDRDSNSILVEEADAATFLGVGAYSDRATALEKKWNFTDYASDASYVFYRGEVLEGANSETAVLLKENLLNVYIAEGMDQLKGDDGYLKNRGAVYYRGRLLEGADGESLGWMPLYQRDTNASDYVRDQHHIYYYGEKVAGDPKTAFALHHGYYMDANHIYFRGNILEGASPDAFEQFKVFYGEGRTWPSVFIISNDRVFYRSGELPLDAKSFELLDTFSGPDYAPCGGGTYAGNLLHIPT